MTQLAAILNVTPDSFSDGGRYLDADKALAAVHRMAGEGADIIDIGAESTRPGATPLAHEEEWQRLEKLLPQLGGVCWGLDTRHAETAHKALALNPYWINDVSGFTDDAMIEAVRDHGCRLVVMHSLSVPADRNKVLPENADVIEEILNWVHTRLGYLESLGIAKERIIFDPGIGFGKTAQQSREIIRRIDAFKALGLPLFIGHSRKSFLEGNRDEATLAVSRQLIAKHIDYLRIHDVAAHRALL